MANANPSLSVSANSNEKISAANSGKPRVQAKKSDFEPKGPSPKDKPHQVIEETNEHIKYQLRDGTIKIARK
jgi:hypothetical protein